MDRLEKLAAFAGRELVDAPNGKHFIKGTFIEWDPFHSIEQAMSMLDNFPTVSYTFASEGDYHLSVKVLNEKQFGYTWWESSGTADTVPEMVCESILRWISDE